MILCQRQQAAVEKSSEKREVILPKVFFCALFCVGLSDVSSLFGPFYFKSIINNKNFLTLFVLYIYISLIGYFWLPINLAFDNPV